MNADHILNALETIDDKYILQAKEQYDTENPSKYPKEKVRSIKRTVLLVAAIAVILFFCGFAAYEIGLFDPWLQQPSADPIKTVQSAIEGQAGKEYTKSIRIHEIRIDEIETERVKRRYKNSELEAARGWTDENIEDHFVVVWAGYYVEYDHTKTFLDDGYTEQYFYLMENTESGEWKIVDNTGSLTAGD